MVPIVLLAPFLAPPPARAAGPLPLEALYDNTAVGDDARPGTADLDGTGASLSARDLTAAGWTPGRAPTVQGARLRWPRRAPGVPDNVRAAGQSVRLAGRGDALAFLVTSTGGAEAGGPGTVQYTDGSRSPYRLTAPDWRTGPLATRALALPHITTPAGQLTEKARLYVVTVPLARSREIASVRLPVAPDLHVFALSRRSAAPPGWTGSWATATSGHPAVGPWTDRTLRLVVHTSAGGPRVRLRFENAFASAPLRIGGATVAVRAAPGPEAAAGTPAGARGVPRRRAHGGAAAHGTPVPLSFGGAAGVEVPAGAQAVSDPLAFAVPAGADLLVSFHLPGTVASAPVHGLAVQRSYVSEPGDHTADAGGTAYTSTVTSWPLLTGVDVGDGVGAVALLGDSITDGSRSTTDANRRWPDALAARLRRQDAVPRYGVLNVGISGNRVVADRYPGDGVSKDLAGVSAVHRLDRDVFARTGVRTLVVFEGINDLGDGTQAARVIEGLREIAVRARERGVRVLGATLLPCGGATRCTAAVEAERAVVNAWIREADAFDGVLDFDRALRDPAAPARLLPAYDSGDHLHPGDAGYAALAQAVDLKLL
ncbi:SGNH/GDSL hydrolase family protein [Streptomyces sp. NBC_01275]|uniref:SGNH/GDSL hydrolase family protein n=1 Tax=Streptomyces sp. NBC_01275 TaxID=2903807 RepID=UPI0022573602|nr:SGNH/GDSL hydrolase family protein [Streptomyces sp. NBC_01275]MCX4766119.1 SGNH/GDSL hydrolase family protein [Streptomyces sp. NBC_01275]